MQQTIKILFQSHPQIVRRGVGFVAITGLLLSGYTFIDNWMNKKRLNEQINNQNKVIAYVEGQLGVDTLFVGQDLLTGMKAKQEAFAKGRTHTESQEVRKLPSIITSSLDGPKDIIKQRLPSERAEQKETGQGGLATKPKTEHLFVYKKGDFDVDAKVNGIVFIATSKPTSDKVNGEVIDTKSGEVNEAILIRNQNTQVGAFSLTLNTSSYKGNAQIDVIRKIE